MTQQRCLSQTALWSPTIRAAIIAGTPRPDVYCPGCRTSRAIDIRTIDRHPLRIKSPEQHGQLMQHRTRDLLIRQRTQVINALRAHLAELGIVAAVAGQ